MLQALRMPIISNAFLVLAKDTGLNGIEVASVLQRVLPDAPIILHTIYGDHVGRSFGAVFGIRAIVAKSDGINKLIDLHSVLKAHPNRIKTFISFPPSRSTLTATGRPAHLENVQPNELLGL